MNFLMLLHLQQEYNTKTCEYKGDKYIYNRNKMWYHSDYSLHSFAAWLLLTTGNLEKPEHQKPEDSDGAEAGGESRRMRTVQTDSRRM